MNRQRFLSVIGVGLIFALLFLKPNPSRAQESQPTATVQPFLMYTPYPSQIIGFGVMVDVPLKLRGGTPQTVQLEVKNLPQGWNATFRGDSQIVEAVYVTGQDEATVDLRLKPPADVKAGKYDLVVAASGASEKADLPLSFTIEEKLPP